MGGVAGAIGGAMGLSAVGSIFGAKEQSKSASKASAAQVQAAQLGVDEQKRQFDALKEMLSPYRTAGTGALSAYQNLLGLGGAEAQQSAISGIESGPQMAALLKQGENAILQNASATGGLRGGNTQSALQEFRPQLLNQLINQQLSQYGGLTSMGQSSAAMTGNAGMQSANQISNLYGQMGSAQAGKYLAQGQAKSNMISGLTGLGSFGLGYFGGF